MKYVVQPGDTLCLIAEKFGVDVNRLYQMNPEIRDPNLLIAGQIILIPTESHYHGGSHDHHHGPRPPEHDHGPRPPRPPHEHDHDHVPRPPRPKPMPPRPKPMPPRPPRQRYVVQSGDTMFFIARRFGISLGALIAANPQIDDPNVLFPGQIIFIP